jgi:hypothetical protein
MGPRAGPDQFGQEKNLCFQRGSSYEPPPARSESIYRLSCRGPKLIGLIL